MRETRTLILTLVLLILATPLMARGVPKDNLDDYGRGVITDYSDMEGGDQVEWMWIAPGVKLSDYRIDVSEFENLSKVNDTRMLDTLNDGMQTALTRIEKQRKGEPKGTLRTETAVFWAERASQGKRWIPYAGGHLAQAGCGIEIVFKDEDGKIVAKIRHSGREGGQPSDAAWELIDEVADFVFNH